MTHYLYFIYKQNKIKTLYLLLLSYPIHPPSPFYSQSYPYLHLLLNPTSTISSNLLISNNRKRMKSASLGGSEQPTSFWLQISFTCKLMSYQQHLWSRNIKIKKKIKLFNFNLKMKRGILLEQLCYLHPYIITYTLKIFLKIKKI